MKKIQEIIKLIFIPCGIVLFLLLGLSGRVEASTNYLDDQANVLAKQTGTFLKLKNRDLDRGQIYVVTVKSTGKQPIEKVASKYFKKHHLGKNATMLMIAVNDRKVHFQKGSKIGEIFGDNYLSTILTEYVKDDFREKNFDAGVQLMVSKLADTLNNEDYDDSSDYADDDSIDPILSIFMIAGLVIFGIISLINKLFSRDDSNNSRYDHHYNDDYYDSGFWDSGDSDGGDSGDTGGW